MSAPPTVRGNRSPSGTLLTVLGVAFGLAIIVGNTIGMGILRTPGEVAAHLPSVPLYLSVWVLGAAYALLGALTLAELATMIPRSGGQFVLVHEALGPFPAFLVGWTDWISTCGSMAAVAIVIGGYVAPLIPALEGHVPWTASAVVLAFALIQWRGIKTGDRVQQVTSFLKALSLLALALVAIALGLRGDSATISSAITVAPTPLPSGMLLFSAIILAAQSAIFTYDGWTGAIYFSEEVEDPGANLPRAMIGGVLAVMAIYLALNIAFVLVLPITEMAGDPFVAATVATRLFGPMGDTLLRVLMIISLLAAVNALQLIASRVPYAMSREGFLPAGLARVNAGGTPTSALVAGTVVALGFIATNTFDTVLALLAFFFVANYCLSFTSLFVMRWRQPDRPRPFRVPWYPWVPGLALAGSIAFLLGGFVSDTANSLWGLGLVGLSVPAYFLARRKATAT